jgi:toxin YoeB
MSKIWSDNAWEQYLKWQTEDKQIVQKINELLKDIERNGLNKGIGHPEPLKHIKAWSRHINSEHRLVYNLDGEKNIIVIACQGHYKK